MLLTESALILLQLVFESQFLVLYFLHSDGEIYHILTNLPLFF
jgi:hypothetical protein